MATSDQPRLFFIYLRERWVGPALARSESEAIEKIIRSTPWLAPYRFTLQARFVEVQDTPESPQRHDAVIALPEPDVVVAGAAQSGGYCYKCEQMVRGKVCPQCGEETWTLEEIMANAG